MCEQVKDPWLESELNEEKKEKRISQEDMKVENLFENGKLRRLLLLETLGKDYLSFCLINTKRRTVVVLNTGFENMENGTDMGPELPYEETCARIVEKYAPENQKAYILEKEKLGRLKQERETSDYDDFYIASAADATEQYAAAEFIITEVKQYLDGENVQY